MANLNILTRAVDLDLLIEKVREVAAEKPDFTYDRKVDGRRACVYFDDGQPSCIVGNALHRLGFTHADVIEEALEPEYVTAPDAEWSDLVPADIRVAWLAAAQSQQDVGSPWGAAVQTADDHHPLDGE